MTVLARLAHLSDPHLGPLPGARWRDLLNKRLTGYLNWRFNRSQTHDMGLLATLTADLRAQAPDLIACTGDVAHIGLPAEFDTARTFLEGLGTPERLAFVPGNHDIYVRGALAALTARLSPWMTGETEPGVAFPFWRRHGRLVLIGLNSSVPTPPFSAQGRLGAAQIAAAGRCLDHFGAQGLCRIILVHHAPYIGASRAIRALTDAADFEAMLARAGAELVLHGHNHIASLEQRPGPAGPVPILGAPSASYAAGEGLEQAGYHLLTVREAAGGYAIEATTRGLLPDGCIGPIRTIDLSQDSLGENRALVSATA